MQCSNFYVIPGLVAFHYVQFGSLNNVRETEHNFQVISICVADKGEVSKSIIYFQTPDPKLDQINLKRFNVLSGIVGVLSSPSSLIGSI